MTPLAELVVALLDAVPADVGTAADGVRLEVADLAIALPVETRLGADGTLRASAPRGRLATGFDPAVALMHLAITRESA